MLKVDEIIYPITFNSYGVGKFKFTCDFKLEDI